MPITPKPLVATDVVSTRFPKDVLAELDAYCKYLGGASDRAYVITEAGPSRHRERPPLSALASQRLCSGVNEGQRERRARHHGAGTVIPSGGRFRSPNPRRRLRQAEDHMRFVFQDARDSGRKRPTRHLADVEIVFDEAEPAIAGLKLVGTALWLSDEGEVLVTLPARKVADTKGKEWHFDLVRSVDGRIEPIRDLKGRVIAAYQDAGGAMRLPSTAERSDAR